MAYTYLSYFKDDMNGNKKKSEKNTKEVNNPIKPNTFIITLKKKIHKYLKRLKNWQICIDVGL